MLYSAYKLTILDWCRSFVLNSGKENTEELLVKVSVLQTGPNPPVIGKWKILIKGTDDFGMEKEFSVLGDADKCFLEIMKLDLISIYKLEVMGFTFH